MALFGKMRAKFHDDWCEDCLEQMQTVKKQLFFMPQSVGHYTRYVKLTPFLPVRDAEKNELPLLFMKGELDALVDGR